MTLRTSIQQAAINALMAWIQKDLADSSIVISARWPDPNTNLPPKAISILPAGEREEEYFDPYVVQTEKIDASHERSWWAVASITQPLQLDIWALDSFDRDDLVARLDETLRRGVGYTLGLPNQNPVRQGVLLSFADTYWGNGATVDIVFDRMEQSDEADRVNETEYRATARGEAHMTLTVQATTPAMANIEFKMRFIESL